jgi:hypothetical protein
MLVGIGAAKDHCSLYVMSTGLVQRMSEELQEIKVSGLPDDMGKGACIWEPLNHWSGLFDRNNEVTELMGVYDELNTKYLKRE